MGGYDGYEYEDLDEYEEDGEEEEEAGEEEYEEEEDPLPTKEVLDYLELRQRLKEEKRKKLKKELGAGSSREKKNVMSKPKDNYGSFFGPSQPIIAQRVIQESKSLLENPNLAARVMKSNQTVNKSSGSTSAGPKPQTNGERPKVTNGLQTKVQMLKNTRDYSFLLSDDADLPAQSKGPPTRNVFPPKSEAGTAQLPERSKEMLNSNGRKVFNSREDKKPTPTVGRVQPRVVNERSVSMDKHNRGPIESRKMLSGSNRTLADPRKQHSSSNGSGPGRPQHPSSNGSGPGRPQHSSSNGSGLGRPQHPSGNGGGLGRPQHSSSNGSGLGRPQHSSSSGSGPGRPQHYSSNGSGLGRLQHSSNNGSGPGRPVVSKGVPSKIPAGTAEKKVGVPAPRLPPTSVIQKPAPSKLHHPVSKPSLIRRGETLESRKPSMLTKQMVPPQKPKVSQPPPRNSARSVPVDDRPKKKPRRREDDDDDAEDAISEIRKMFGYNPRRYADEDDDSDMEANFDDIMREEEMSARIARKEDEEELRKLEEEERREKLRKDAKKRKMVR